MNENEQVWLQPRFLDAVCAMVGICQDIYLSPKLKKWWVFPSKGIMCKPV